MRLKISVWLVVLFFLIQLAQAQSGKNGLPFLKMDVDARAAALGGAYTARTTGAAAAYWNPAGLAAAQNLNFLFMHTAWLADITQDFAAVQLLHGTHNLALSVNVFTVPGVEIRGDKPTDQPFGKVDAVNFYAAFSYGRAVNEQWSYGFTVKYLFEKYYLESAPGWAMDAGVIYRGFLPGARMAFVLQNLGRMSPLQTERTPLPLMARYGLNYIVPFQVLRQNPSVSLDVQWVRDEAVYLRAGAEAPVTDYLFLRAGLISGNDQTLLTAGAGVNYKGFHLDYAFVPVQDNLGSGHRLSLGFIF